MIKVLVIDDSPLIRNLLTAILEQFQDLTVVGVAEDPYEARELIKSLNPDVLTLDIEMPKMDGLSFLRNLMRLRPMPVVMISTLTQKGSPITLEALEIGAVDFIAKPTINVKQQLQFYADLLHEKIVIASQAKVRVFRKTISEKIDTPTQQFKDNALIAIGASTGGTEAIKEVLMQLPDSCPPVLVTQHIPLAFSASFAKRMNNFCVVNVKQAQSGDKVLKGNVYIAPGDKHLTVIKKSGQLECLLVDSEPVNRHKPSVDVLFESLLPIANTVYAVILTGMGNDGANALLKLKQAGATTLTQDKHTSVVWGMPRVAFEIGAACKVLPLGDIAAYLLKVTAKKYKAKALQ
jgi:two-component system, chemotaxis family, protein-glutamate methylesterase/glutaminase